MATQSINRRAAASLALAATALGIVATLGTGAVRWGDLGARVEALEVQVGKKADAGEQAEIRKDVREIRADVRQILVIVGERRK